MDELKAHVDKLFEPYQSTPETRELKEEILGNMAAKRDDLMAQGESEGAATRHAAQSLASLEGLVDDSLLVDRGEGAKGGFDSHSPFEHTVGYGKKGWLAAGVLCVCALALAVLAVAHGSEGWSIQDLVLGHETGSEVEESSGVATHDISVVEDFRSPYLGDASNTSHLFSVLPLAEVPFMIQIDSDACSLTVNYLDTVWNVGEDYVRRSLVYNTVAAMAAIDNLQAVTYEFSGDSFTFERSVIEGVFGSPLSDLLDDPTLWNERVRDPLGSTELVDRFYG